MHKKGRATLDPASVCLPDGSLFQPKGPVYISHSLEDWTQLSILLLR
jgi:hypothetical protein